MWNCPFCGQAFARINQVHSCMDRSLSGFFEGKGEHTVSLFRDFAGCFLELGDVTIHPTKSMIAFAAARRIAYVIRLGKNFIDVVFPFDRPYEDNLCFRKIAQVPGTSQYNHHLRLENKDDINAEVRRFMKMAVEKGT